MHGWLWGPASQGTIPFKPVTPDLAVSLKLTHIETVSGPATGTGSLSVIFRATLKDPLAGDMTTVDAFVAFPISLTNGSASVKSTFDAVPVWTAKATALTARRSEIAQGDVPKLTRRRGRCEIVGCSRDEYVTPSLLALLMAIE